MQNSDIRGIKAFSNSERNMLIWRISFQKHPEDRTNIKILLKYFLHNDTKYIAKPNVPRSKKATLSWKEISQVLKNFKVKF